MNFYCEECERMYDEKDLNKRHYLNLGEDCYECPECENTNLVAIAQNTKLDVCWDEKTESITSIEYDIASYEIIKSNNLSLKDVAKVIQHYINYFELESVEIEGLKIQKVVDGN